MAEPNHEDVVYSALTSQKLFEGCDPDLLKRLAAQAFSWTPGRGHEIPMRDEMPLMIVVSGELYVCIGGGPAATASTGFMIGFVGMLRLHETAQKKTRSPGKLGTLVVDVADLIAQREEREDLEDEEDDFPRETYDFELPDESEYTLHVVKDCIQNLCPHTIGISKVQWSEKSTVPLRMEMVDALTNQRNILQTEDTQSGFCKLACISLERIYDLFAMTPSLDIFESHQLAVTKIFDSLLHLAAFPNVPLEVVWMLASVSEIQKFARGEVIVKEGDSAPQELLLILASGSADVKKILFDSSVLEAQNFKLARLHPGTIIGDICFMESWVARPATVIAREDVEMICIPSRKLLDVLAAYPGMASIWVSRSRETSLIMQKSLARPADVLAGMKLFHGLNPTFIRSLANITERKMNFLGDVLKEEASTDRTLRLLEFGKIRVEKQHEGCVGLSGAGTLLGEHMFLGLRRVSQATFRVATPLVVMLWVPHHAFENILADGYPSEAAYFRSLEETDNGVENMAHFAGDLKLFLGCGRRFIQTISEGIYRRSYKPGQTIVIQKAIDSGSLFLLTTGKASAVINGKVTEELLPGGVFGELTLLGLVLLRAATVEATTYCSCLEMPRQAFLEALDKHPEETDHFEKLTRLHSMQVATEQGTWPFMTKASERLLYYMNLHSTRESTRPGEWASRAGVELSTTDMAYLLVSGEVYVIEENGHRTLMPEGSCFGEHILIGLAPGIASVEPKTACEVQMVNRHVFEKVMAECPEERETTIQGILDEMAIKAEQKLGIQRGLPDLLRCSALFRAANPDFMKLMRPRMYAMLFKAGDFITRERDYANHMFVVVRGSAAVRCEDDVVLRFRAGTAISEASLLGACTFHPYMVKSENLCLILTLSRDDFVEVLQDFPAEQELFQRLDPNAEDILRRLPRVLKIQHPLFNASSIDFLKAACEFADEVYYAPGECIIEYGESCSLGKTVMYLLVAGNASVILAHGDEVAQIKSGALVGEGGALGIANKRSTQISAWKAGMVRLIRLQGLSIGKAVQKCPDDCKALEQQFAQRSQKNAEAEAIRKEWIGKSVIPLLKQCQILNGFSMKLVSKIAGPLLKTTFSAGQDMFVAGDAADSMIVIVDGEAEAKCKNGKVVARLTTGAVTGELAVLGLLSFRTATFTASRKSDAVVITAQSLQSVLQSSEAASKHLDKLAEERRMQIERGYPILAMPLGASNDVCCRTISLHATRYILAPGETWKIPANAPASGAHHWVFARGRGVILAGPSDHPMNPIQTVGAGATCLVSESLCLQYGARVVALTPVEAFRISCMDIQLATISVRNLPNWFPRFRALEREACKHLKDKLFRAKSVIDMAKPQKAQILKPLPVKHRSCTRLHTPGPLNLPDQDLQNQELEKPSFLTTPRNPFGRSENPLGPKRPASQSALLDSYPSHGGKVDQRHGSVRLRPLSATRPKTSQQ